MATCLCGLFALCFAAAPTHAQYRFDHWTTDNGLPQNSVRSILQTRDGYLWLATFDGLVRFDGVRFTVFNKSNSPGLASNRFLQLFEDRSGDLWVSLETGGLVRRHQGRFTTYLKGQGLPFDGFPAMSDDGQGNLMITSGGSSFRWQEGQFRPADEPRRSANLPPHVERDRTRYLHCWPDNRQLSCFVNGQILSWARTESPVTHFLGGTQDEQGDIWLNSAHSLTRVRDGRVAQVYDERNGLPGMNPALVIGSPHPRQAISRDASGGLWLTDLDSMQSRILSAHPPEGMLTFAYADNEGNYWFSTHNNGLFRARRQTVTAYTKAQGLNAGEVYPLLEGRDGSIWIGTMGNGLFRFQNGAFTNYTEATLFEWEVTSLYEDRAGRLWVDGKWLLTDGGFVRETKEGGLLGEVWQASERYSLGNVWTMCEDRAGAYWLGSDRGVLHYQNGVMNYYTTQDGLAANDTKVIIPDSAGGVWLGSYGGLTHYRDGRFTAWTEKDGLPGATVRALKQDGDGTLWIGTYDSGLGRFKDGRFTRYTQKDGLHDDGVFQILEDDDGWFWMSCNRGVYRVRKQELNDFADGKIKAITSLAYTKSDGMPSAECNGGRWPAGIKARDGKLWFPTMGGVAMIDPASVRLNSKPPPVVIEEVRIDNQPVEIESGKSAIQVEPGQENFEIRYTALSFVNSENLKFKYTLEEYHQDWVEAGTRRTHRALMQTMGQIRNQEWVEAGTRRTAYFSRVPPGAYTFKVIAANSDGVWNTEGQSLRITVLPPFYRTWWFLTLAALGVAAAVFAIFKYRVAQFERRQAAQQAFAQQLIESQERERKRIAAELHDGLGQNLLIVKNRAQLGQLAAQQKDPEMLEQFEWIVSSATQSIEEVREIAQNLRPYHLDRLGLTKALEIMLEKVAATTRIRFVSELVPLDDLFSKEDAITLYRVVQESLNNIIKHAAASEVRVGVERLTDYVTLTIQDNGRGFSPSAAAAQSSGFGLAGMAERVRMLGGECRIDAQEGRGTTVTIRLALPVTNKGR